MQLLVAGALLCCVFLSFASSKRVNKNVDDVLAPAEMDYNQIVASDPAQVGNVPAESGMPDIAPRRRRPFGRHRPGKRPNRHHRPSHGRLTDTLSSIGNAADNMNSLWNIQNGIQDLYGNIVGQDDDGSDYQQ